MSLKYRMNQQDLNAEQQESCTLYRSHNFCFVNEIRYHMSYVNIHITLAIGCRDAYLITLINTATAVFFYKLHQYLTLPTYYNLGRCSKCKECMPSVLSYSVAMVITCKMN